MLEFILAPIVFIVYNLIPTKIKNVTLKQKGIFKLSSLFSKNSNGLEVKQILSMSLIDEPNCIPLEVGTSFGFKCIIDSSLPLKILRIQTEIVYPDGTLAGIIPTLVLTNFPKRCGCQITDADDLNHQGIWKIRIVHNNITIIEEDFNLQLPTTS